MKKIFSFIALAFLSVSAFAQTCVETNVNLTGTASITFTRYEHKNLTGVFSVAADKYVLFSQGNLQYQASTNTWRFAEEQYERMGTDGYTHNGTVYSSGNSTAYASRATQSNWIDLFGWATSGWDGKGEGILYQPWALSNSNTAYRDGDVAIALTGSYVNADWAYYNKIINGGLDSDGPQSGAWRLLTDNEWQYIFKTRDGANDKCAFGSLMGVSGIYLLPDNWNWATIDGGSFKTNWTPIATAQLFTNNVLTDASLWSALEAAGVVFLPCTGNRSNTSVRNTDTYGYYWSSTDLNIMKGSYVARGVLFYSGTLSSPRNLNHEWGCAVRAVRDL